MSLADDLDAALLRSPVVTASTFRWATVTQASPLRIRLDGETSPLDLTPDTLVAILAVSNRVRVELTPTGAAIIHGKAQ